jgi:hypothetical protein
MTLSMVSPFDKSMNLINYTLPEEEKINEVFKKI